MRSDEITEELFRLADTEYKTFHSKLMPTVDPETILGVRIPVLRSFAKRIMKEDNTEFLNSLPHRYYDENNLHGMLICGIDDYAEAVMRMDEFLPYVDNWATCDLTSPKVFKKHRSELLSAVERWLASDRVYTVRFGIDMLMAHYLDEDFRPEYLDAVASVGNEDYYVRMAVAWYFATALAKQWDNTVPYIERASLEKWTHNKTIQKAVESFRVSDERKAYLKTMKIK